MIEVIKKFEERKKSMKSAEDIVDDIKYTQNNIDGIKKYIKLLEDKRMKRETSGRVRVMISMDDNEGKIVLPLDDLLYKGLETGLKETLSLNKEKMDKLVGIFQTLTGTN